MHLRYYGKAVLLFQTVVLQPDRGFWIYAIRTGWECL